MDRTKTLMFIFLFGILSINSMRRPKISPEARKLGAKRNNGGSVDTVNGSCDSNLLQSFGFFGRDTPRPTSLITCPRVINSCWTVQDQIIAYNNWVGKNEVGNLNVKFNNYTATIEEFFEVAENVTHAAQEVINYMEYLDNNECKMMARRVLSYQIDDVMEALLDEFESTFEFYEDSYEGLYCALADAHQQTFFNPSSKKVTISEKFCRSIITGSLTSLLYFKVHIPKYINLLSTFVTTCDEKGNFKPKSIPSPYYDFVDPSVEKQLRSCFKGRNTQTWLSSCQSVCQKWGVGKVDPFYMPDWNQLNKTIHYLQDELEDWDIDWEHEDHDHRVLEEKRNTKKVHRERRQERKLQNINVPAGVNLTGFNISNMTNLSSVQLNLYYLKFLDKSEQVPLKLSTLPLNPNAPSVFVSQNTQLSPALADYSVEIAFNGIDFYEISQFSVLEEDAIEILLGPEVQVPTPDAAASPPPTATNEIHADGAGQRKLSQHRKLSGSSIIQMFTIALLALLTKF